MGNLAFLFNYVQSCTGGKLPSSECGAVWQLLIIAVLLVLAVSTLIVLRVRARFVSTT